ncbi:MAG TPA: hypothetical protein VME42_10000 [Steroidobacteraceae bacterium]|nr:hypothetical protein [Steroidobacteraceae bacterium]
MTYSFDDEGFAAKPWDLQIQAVAANGSITGTATTYLYGGTEYPVSGTVTGSGTLEIAFTFAVGGSPELPFEGISYSYKGAMEYVDSECDLFVAGTYTSTYDTFEVDKYGILVPVAHTSAPMPFSGLLQPIFY